MLGSWPLCHILYDRVELTHRIHQLVVMGHSVEFISMVKIIGVVCPVPVGWKLTEPNSG